LSGLYFTGRRFFDRGFRDGIDDQGVFPFWEEVESLRILVFRCELAWTGGTARNHGDQMSKFDSRAQISSVIQSVLVMFFPRQLSQENTRVDLPTALVKVWTDPSVFLEVIFLVGEVRWSDYPYPETQPVLKYVYEELGAQNYCEDVTRLLLRDTVHASGAQNTLARRTWT